MKSQPATPKQESFRALNSLPSPVSPSPFRIIKRKASGFLTPQSQNPWGPQPLTPPITHVFSEDDGGTFDFKRTCVSWHRSATDAAFAGIERDIDATAPAQNQLEIVFPEPPANIDPSKWDYSFPAQTDSTCTWNTSGEVFNNGIENLITDQILAGPSDGYLSCDTDLYDVEEIPESENDEVCFGMIQVDSFDLAPSPCLPWPSRSVSRLHDLQLTQTGCVVHEESGSSIIIGTVSSPMLEILRDIDRQRGMSVQLHCLLKQTSTNLRRRKGPDTTMQLSADLHAILYGPLCAFDSIGEFLEDYDIYLQDPEGCDRNVRYRNPHRISGQDVNVPMTIDREVTPQKGISKSDVDGPEYFDSLAMHSELACADDPTILKAKLYPYQQQALSFMLTRERGWNSCGLSTDVWTQTNIDGIRVYLNNITDETQLAAPPQFRGGLLADQMGLGKTISIIALIASDLCPPTHAMGADQSSQVSLPSRYSRCTLIIVPPNLLDTWETQLRQHCKEDSISWSRHHDKTRFSLLSQLSPYHVILTTYNTVSTEWRNHKSSSILYSTDWHRIVLDEAHSIKGEHNQLARAICDLKACRRWAVTGTPIQNHVNDLQVLLKFLRVYPYDRYTNFDRDIIRLWKIDSEAAMTRLKKLITCITLRRTGNAIQLPPKTELLFTLPFSLEEEELYRPLEAKISHIVHRVSVYDSSTAATRAHALKGLHLLRSVCNLGTLTDTRNFISDQNSAGLWGRTDAQITFESLTMSNAMSCVKCACDVGNLETSTETSSNYAFPTTNIDPVMSQCEQVLCGTCTSSLQEAAESMMDWCGHIPACASFPVSTLKSSIASLSSVGPRIIDPKHLPTKIKELVKDILLHTSSKSVVFSCWRTTLDLVAIGLDSAKVKFVRFDGEVKHKDRTSALYDLQNDPTVQVLLITMSCGAVGLNLTAASRAYIMEPQWNPTTEDQAMSRIHRLGQEQPVTIIRFVMADSIEQRIMEVKSNKKSFTELLFASKKKALHSGHGLGSFESWKSLLS